MKIILASANKSKIKEIKAIFSKKNIEILSLHDIGNPPEIEENGSSFEENAFIKAKAIYDLHKIPVISDDSGLCVEALGNQPGIFSARYAGEPSSDVNNRKKMLQETKSFSEPIKAKFMCCAMYYDGFNKIHELGELNGQITRNEIGDNGFGYDPIFMPIGYKKTLAEIDSDEKNKISHRGKAFEKLYQTLLNKNLI